MVDWQRPAVTFCVTGRPTVMSAHYLLPRRRRQAQRAAPAGSNAKVVGSGTEPGESVLGSEP